MEGPLLLCDFFPPSRDPRVPSSLGSLSGMWHSDKPIIQHELAQLLAKTVHLPRGENAFLYMGAFWATMHREWYSSPLSIADVRPYGAFLGPISIAIASTSSCGLFASSSMSLSATSSARSGMPRYSSSLPGIECRLRSNVI